MTPAAKRMQAFPLSSSRTVLTWSPNGAYMAIVTDSALEHRFQLAILRVPDLLYTLIANNLPSFDFEYGDGESFAVWSLDSQTLSFGAVDVQSSADTILVWRLKAWHSDRQQIEYPVQMVGTPHFSADRTHALVVDVASDQHWHNSLLDVRSGSIQRLARANENTPGPQAFAFWEHSGNLIWVETEEPDGVHFIWANANGSNVRQVVISNNYLLSIMGPPASPYAEGSGAQFCHSNQVFFADSSAYRLLYTGNDEKYATVWLLDLRTQALHKLLSTEALINTYISPNGQFIALSQSDDCSLEEVRANSSMLVIASVDGSIIHKQAIPAMLHSATWSPDGTMLIYNVYDSTSTQIISRDGTLIRQYDDAQISELNGVKWMALCRPALANQ